MVALLEIFSTNSIRYTLEDHNTSWGGAVIEGTFLQQLPRPSTARTCLPHCLLPFFTMFGSTFPSLFSGYT